MTIAHAIQVRRSARIDPTGRYRYRLSREWDPRRPRIAFVMLNPSTADHTQDDPTIRRCTAFAERWGFGSLDVVNLFALRTTDPRGLTTAVDPIGPGNLRAIRSALDRADEVLLAWGTSVRFAPPPLLARSLRSLARRAAGRPLACLGMTNAGHPRHPLFVRAVAARSRCEFTTAHKKGAARSDRPVSIKLID